MPEQMREPEGSGKKPLYMRMYFDPAYVDFVRFIGYAGKPLEEAHKFLVEMEAKYGRAKVIEAGEAVSKAEGKKDNMVVQLTAEARRLAVQLLGRPPEAPPQMSLQEMVGLDPAKAKPVEKPKEKPKRMRKKMPVEPPTEKPTIVNPPSSANTPMMQQWREAKERHPGMLLVFRLGDFYELFDEDARTAAKLLGLTITTRDRDIDMAGFSHHALEAHLHKLLKAGQRVAVCDPVDSRDGLQAKREVTRVVTPEVAQQ